MNTITRFNRNNWLPRNVIALGSAVVLVLATGVLADEKAAPTSKSAASAPKSSPPADTSTNWEDRYFSEMQQFETRMDNLFNEAFQPLQKDIIGAGKIPANFDSSVKLKEEPNAYVVRFALPTTETQKANVSVKDGQLRLSTSEQTETFGQPGLTGKENANEEKSSQPRQETSLHYEEAIALPGPVDVAGMKVQKSVGIVTVTLPKQDASAGSKNSTK